MASRTIVGFVLILTLLIGCSTQRVNIPTISESPRTSLILKKPLLVSILDARTTKNKSADVINSIEKGLKDTYGNSLKMVNFFSKTPPGSIALKIRLKANEANFESRIVTFASINSIYSELSISVSNKWSQVVINASQNQTFLNTTFLAQGLWVGTSWVEVELIDNSRNNAEKISFPLVAEHTESNTWGYKSASKASEKSWNIVSQQLIEVMDNVLLQLQETGY